MFTHITAKTSGKRGRKPAALPTSNLCHNETLSRRRPGCKTKACECFYCIFLFLAAIFLLLTTSLSAGQEVLAYGPATHVSSPVIEGSAQKLMAEGDQEAFPQIPPTHYRLEKYLMDNYNPKLIPRRNKKRPISVHFSIGLYQIIEVNEPQQYILLNSWIVERWKDELFYWRPEKFDGVTEIVLPREDSWIPDTTLYNSLVMNDAESRRLSSVKITTLQNEKTALVEMLYPTLYKFSCMLDLKFFPFDVQHCVMTFGSWTHDNKAIDYHPHNGTTGGAIGTEHCIENEGWNILSTDVLRREEKFQCCPNNYTLLDFYLHIQRKPLFYLVNLIIPTSVITLIAIVGFFSSSTVNDVREEKISLGITTLLSMSILIFMVSDQMPSTSSFIPLIGWFYTSMMMLISGGTLAASCVIYIQKRGIVGQRPSSSTMRWARRLGKLILMEMPLLMKQAYALKAKQDKLNKQQLAAALAAANAAQRQRNHQTKGDSQQHPFLPNHQDIQSNCRKQTIWSRWQKTSKDMTTFVPNNTNSAQHNSTNSINGRKTSSTMTSLLANRSQANSFWSHFGMGSTHNGRENSATAAASIADLYEGSAGVQPKEENPSIVDGDMANSVSFLEEAPKMHSCNNDMDGTNAGHFDGVEQTCQQVNEDAPPPAPPSNADPSSDNNSGLLSLPNVDTSPSPVRFRQKSAVAAAVAAFSNAREQSNPKFHASSPYVPYLPLQAQIAQLAAASSAGGRPPPLFRRATSSSMTDVFNCLVDPVLNPTSGASNLAAAAAQINGSQMQRNLAEIEYDWLAAVVERLFLLMFLSLFFLMSFGINGIGLYYWYFTTVDTIEHS